MKIVINNCCGGFELSRAGMERFAELKGITLYAVDLGYDFLGGKGRYLRSDEYIDYLFNFVAYFTEPLDAHGNVNYYSLFDKSNIDRTDPALIQVVEELGEKANGMSAHLKIIEIPDGADWVIMNLDGDEWVAGVNMIWS